MAVDGHQITLDLAAFECVDHDILLTRLQSGLGLSGTVLRWIQSFLTNRTHQVAYNGQLSSQRLVPFGVPQGSTRVVIVVFGMQLQDCVAPYVDIILHRGRF